MIEINPEYLDIHPNLLKTFNYYVPMIKDYRRNYPQIFKEFIPHTISEIEGRKWKVYTPKVNITDLYDDNSITIENNIDMDFIRSIRKDLRDLRAKNLM